MNLYRVSWSDEDGHAQNWAGSMREAKSIRAKFGGQSFHMKDNWIERIEA